MNCFNVVPPSWTLILSESWDESKTDFKGEVRGSWVTYGTSSQNIMVRVCWMDQSRFGLGAGFT